MTSQQTNQAGTTPGTADEHDLDAVRRVIADLEAVQNDVEGFTRLLTGDAVIVNIAGRRVVGRDQIGSAMAQALATPLAQVLTRHEIEDVRFVRPDVAVVGCLKHVSDERDDPATALPQTGRLTVVLVKEQGRWLASSLQTTPIAA
jgi:uncharacterized protein (TIGR02246 family)